MMGEYAHLITLLGQVLEDLALVFLSLVLAVTYRMSKRNSALYSSQMKGASSLISMLNRENQELSERLKAISSGIGDTSTLVKGETYTLVLQDLYGPVFLGPVTLNVIGQWLKSHTIVLTADDSCAKNLVTELTTTANQLPSPIK